MQKQVQHVKTYNDNEGACYDVIFSFCCGSFITMIMIVLITVFVNKENNYDNSGSY